MSDQNISNEIKKNTRKKITKKTSGKNTSNDLSKTNDLSKPTNDLSKSTNDLSKPTNDLSKPTNDLSKSTNDLSKPTNDLSKPTNDLGNKKRHYTKRKNVDVSVDKANKQSNQNKQIDVKRRGRKKKDMEQHLNPEQVLDFIIRNYPHFGINRIRDQILVSLKTYNGVFTKSYVLDIIWYQGVKYYYDRFGNILDQEAQNVGQYIEIEGESGKQRKVYMYDDPDDDPTMDSNQLYLNSMRLVEPMKGKKKRYYRY
jgi:hypothetical protein